jgi:hypothetical protein
MKPTFSLLAAIACFPLSPVFAAEPEAPAAGVVVQTAPAPAPKLPYGVEDVVKLSQAQISDDIVLNYVRNSGTIYTLGPQEIVYLRNQGVSDRVINAMLDQRKLASQTLQPAVQQPPAIPNAAGVPDASTAPAAPAYSQPWQVYAEAPNTPPASSVYVIPQPAYAYPYYYPYYGYYGPYYGYYGGPVVSFGFRFGGRGGFGHGGFHGGFGHGGFSHGGFGHGGHR